MLYELEKRVLDLSGVHNRKMNAAVCPKYGGASVLQSQMVDLPHELEDTEVLIGERAHT